MTFCKKKVFLTGGTGLIGTEVVTCLIDQNFDVYGLTTSDRISSNGVRWIKGDLFDYSGVQKIMDEIHPEYLLNFAWCARGDYLTSPLNEKFKQACMALLEAFHQAGGRRAVYAGTCFEYEFKDTPLKETDAINPETLYAKCKNELRIAAERYAANNGISFGWGRIFYVFGKNEHPKRLTAAIINSLRENKVIEIKTSHLKKDYMYTKDIAGAFVSFLESNVIGVVNICTGKAITVGDFASIIAQKMTKTELLDLRNEENDQPQNIVGDNMRLIHEVGYRILYDYEKAIEEILGV